MRAARPLSAEEYADATERFQAGRGELSRAADLLELPVRHRSHFTSEHNKRTFGVRLSLTSTAQGLYWVTTSTDLWCYPAYVAHEIIRLRKAAILNGTFHLPERSNIRLLSGTSSREALTLIYCVLLLAFTAALARWIPALRSTRLDPIVALRWE